MDQTRPLFIYFRSFLNAMTNMVQKLNINGKRVDGELGIRTQDRRIVGTDESTELSRPHTLYHSQKKQSRQTGTRNLPNLSETFVRWGHIFGVRFRLRVMMIYRSERPPATSQLSSLTTSKQHTSEQWLCTLWKRHTIGKGKNPYKRGHAASGSF